jgi:hypothetical protein
VERVVLDLVRRPEVMLEHIEREIEARKSSVADSAEQKAAWLQQLADIERKRSAFQDMTAEGLITIAELRPKLDALEREADKARTEIAALGEPDEAVSDLETIPATVEQYIAELPEIIHEDPERKSSHLKEIYRKLSLKVLVRESGELVITGAFGTRNLAPDDPGPFIGMSATYELDSEAYTWTDVPAPDDPFWDTWREGEQVVRVWRKSLSSQWGIQAARPAATCTTDV